MREVLARNFTLKIISAIAAILFWIVVFNIENEFRDEKLVVPLDVINAESLESKGIVLLSEIPKTMELTVRGREGAVAGVTPADFKVSVDLATITSADETKLTVSEPVCNVNDVYVSRYTKQIDIRLEKLVTKKFPVIVKTTGALEEGYEIIDLSFQPETCELTGLESVVEKIGRVEVVVDLAGLKESVIMERFCKVYDKNGVLLQSDKYMNLDNIKVKADLKTGKRVGVKPLVFGSPAEGYYVSGEHVSPNTVIITGPAERMDVVKEVLAKPVNINNVSESILLGVGLDLPEGVTLYEPEDGVTVSVTIEQMAEKELTFTRNSVELINRKTAGYHYEIIDKTIKVKVKGKKADVENLKNADVKLTADVNNLGDGFHGIPLKIVLPDKFALASADSITVKIERFAEVSIGQPDMTFLNSNENLNYVIVREVKPVFRGMQAALDSLTARGLNPVINVAGLGPGGYNLPLLMDIPQGVILVEDVYINVKVEAKE